MIQFTMFLLVFLFLPGQQSAVVLLMLTLWQLAKQKGLEVENKGMRTTRYIAVLFGDDVKMERY